MPERDAFEEWMQKPGERFHINLPGGDLLLRHAFEAGARSRDAEVEHLRRTLREWLATADGDCPTPIYPESGGQEPCGNCAPCRARALLGEEGDGS